MKTDDTIHDNVEFNGQNVYSLIAKHSLEATLNKINIDHISGLLTLDDSGYLIIGEGKDIAGFLSKATDEICAHRQAKAYRSKGYTNVSVVLNNEAGLEAAQNIMNKYIQNKWVNR